MKRLLKYSRLAVLTALPVFSAAPCLADNTTNYDGWNNGWYTSLSGDVTWKDSSTGGGGNIAIGRSFWGTDLGNFRLEGELGYHDIDADHYFTYMGNAYYDFNGITTGNLKIGPYVGAGLGDATLHFGENDALGRYDITGNAFAYQFMAGLNFVNESAPNATWFLGYRYLGTNYVDGYDNAGFGTRDSLDNSNIELGLRYNF